MFRSRIEETFIKYADEVKLLCGTVRYIHNIIDIVSTDLIIYFTSNYLITIFFVKNYITKKTL